MPVQPLPALCGATVHQDLAMCGNLTGAADHAAIPRPTCPQETWP
ncbi:hypothetical protein [Streptomyces sporangiiformans]|nr:hypothetical protein [Streptomyces sporangiiformans]